MSTQEDKEFVDHSGFFYIIKTADTEDNVYKIGMTKRCNPNKRLCEYPKYSAVKYTIAVDYIDVFEDYIMRKFRILFKRRLEYGIEYYECNDIKKMIDVVHQIWMKYGDKEIQIDKKLENIKPNGIQAFINDWFSKQEDPSSIDLDIAYIEYVKMMKEIFLTEEYAENETFKIYMSKILYT